MKIIIKKSLIGITIFFTVVLLLGSWITFEFYKMTNYDLQDLPKGDLQQQVLSPDGNYTLNIYLSNGGATVAYAIRGEIVYNHKMKRAKNIYWNYPEDSATVSWSSKDTVLINGRYLNILTDEYDWRKDKNWKRPDTR